MPGEDKGSVCVTEAKMTILQLKYVITISNSKSLREASGRLFVSQPALSTSIRELEDELRFRIFERTSTGIRLTEQGKEFLVYAKEAVGQYELIEDRYLKKDGNKMHFSVSMQHYVFAVHAFINVVKETEADKYVFSVHETRTDEVLGNVRDMKSEVGVISFSNSNEKVMRKLFRDYNLKFSPLMTRDTYAYVRNGHPDSSRDEVSLDDLKKYPCISFDQSSESDFYITEEALGDYEFDRLIKTNDRATSAELMSALDGYSIGTGLMIDSLAMKETFMSVKLREEDPLTIGYITRSNHELSEIGQRYVNELLKYR